ncbi:MAG TPA: hypothetical protein VGB94_00230 [Acidobacteriaceae bacterium]
MPKSAIAIKIAVCMSAIALTAATIGCGMGARDTSTSPIVAGAMAGKAYGGPTPIVGATVKIYATTSTGYGVGTLLQEANQVGTSGQDTDSGGNFLFAGGYNCPAGQFAYITITGGNTGANAVNANSVLVSALGRCEDLYNFTGGVYTGYKGPTVMVNELTTVAAAYALGHFSSVTGTGAATVVGIGAPATNNAAQVSGVSTGCVAGVGSCTTTAAAGLAHAFLNAKNLVDPFGGVANATLASGGVLPQQLVNAIGNTLIACVNSAGGTAGDLSACGYIFTYATIGTTAPTDTFSALVNVAANPTFSGTPATAASFLGIATPTYSVYSPTLTDASAVNDLSLAINFPSGLGAAPTTATAACTTVPCQGLLYPQSGALNINDVYYLGNSSASNTAPLDVFAFSSNGGLLGISTNSTLRNAWGLSVDALGNGYFANGGGSSTILGGYFTISAGVPSAISTFTTSGAAKVYNTAVDRANNVWVAGVNTLQMSPAGAPNFAIEASPTITVPSTSLAGLGIDPDQNIWFGAAAALYVLPNMGTLVTPTYVSTGVLTATFGGSTVSGITFTAPASGSSSPYTEYVSSYTTTPGIQPYNPLITSAAITALGAGTFGTVTTSGGTWQSEADGAGTIWLAEANAKSVIAYNPTASTGYRFKPTVGGSTTAVDIWGTTGKPYSVSIDSTGSIWVASPASGNVVQIIGSAAPTWPLISLGKTGTP